MPWNDDPQCLLPGLSDQGLDDDCDDAGADNDDDSADDDDDDDADADSDDADADSDDDSADDDRNDGMMIIRCFRPRWNDDPSLSAAKFVGPRAKLWILTMMILLMINIIMILIKIMMILVVVWNRR